MPVQDAVEKPQKKLLHEDVLWTPEMLAEHAKTRPAMHIGKQETAHLSAVSNALALVWKARAFRAPKLSTVHLSPTKYVVRAEAGPMLPAIERLHTWRGKRLLTEGWLQELEPLRQERFARLFNDKRDFAGWKKYFASATGPTLSQPTYPAILACNFSFAYKTSQGFWGQAFERGLPIDDPFLLLQPSGVGLLILAELDSQWFTGLPFTADDARQLSVHPDITAVWHNTDTDLNVSASSINEICRWL